MTDTIPTTTITAMASRIEQRTTENAISPVSCDEKATATTHVNMNNNYINYVEENTVVLEFDDFVDLQTRLLLLPYIEEEGQGAVIMTCQLELQQQLQPYKNVEGMVLTSIQGQEQKMMTAAAASKSIENDLSKRDFTEILAAIRNQPPPIRLVFKRLLVEKSDQQTVGAENRKLDTQERALPSVVDSIRHHEEKKDDLHDRHLKSSLETLSAKPSTNRAATLSTTTAATSSPVKRQPINSALDDHIQNKNPSESNNHNNINNSLSNSMFALSAWGLRMKAQSEKLAADAMASMNANHNNIKNESSSLSKKEILSLKLDGTRATPFSGNSNNNNRDNTPQCGMYLQTNLGAYFCISAPNNVKKSIHPVTTSTLLCIRKSATEPLVSHCQQSTSSTGAAAVTISTQYNFQWYHSTSHKTRYRAPHSVTSLYPNNDAASITSKATFQSGNYSSGSSCSTVSATSVSDQEWVAMEGAVHATFQPNTTLVGRKLRCVVTIRQVQLTVTSSSSEEGDDAPPHCDHLDDNSTTSHKDEPVYTISLADQDDDDDDRDQVVAQVLYDLLEPVRADMVLFNGARQAMLRGAKFGNMIRRVNSVEEDGLDPKTTVFRVEVAMARKTTIKTQKTVSVNAVHFSRFCPETDDYIPLTDQPLLQVSARVDTNHARHVDLIFTTFPSSTRNQHPDDDENAYTTNHFLKEYCVPDTHTSSRNGLKLELEAPNRLTRESFLLALGIANYQGNPSLLDDKTVLYCDEVPLPPTKVIETPNNSNKNRNNINDKPSSPRGLTVSQLPPKQLSNVTTSKDDDSLSTASDSDGEAVCANLPNSPLRHLASTVSQPSPSGFFSCQSTMPENGVVVPPPVVASAAAAVGSASVLELQRELEFLRSELARKDRNVVDLQRQVQRSESALQKTKQSWHTTEQELKHAMQDCERIQISKRQVEHSLQSQHDSMQKAETTHKQQMAKLEQTIQLGVDKISDLEKANRALQNEKAVLTAAVEARESKLVRMGALQAANEKLSLEMTHQKALQAKLDQSEERREALQQELKAMTEAEGARRQELDDAMRKIETLQKRIDGEQTKASSHQVQLDSLMQKNQQLKGERNNYKQKNESLSKEISRLCRDGRTIRDIEKLVADHEALVQEAELLRVQKRKALEDAHRYRTSYEQIKASEQVLGVEEDTLRAVERSAELERLLTEMTDYVQAKEMQLETMKQVNEALQEEIHNLAKASRQMNEV
jgi:hypothetical protein